MGRFAERVYTDQADIARLEALAVQLPDEAKVEVTLRDGGAVTGVVSVRPVVQAFIDPEGREGINGVVRIDDARDPDHAHYLWLDRIGEVRRLGSA